MQQFIHINLQFVQMEDLRLDRLTALLEGLSPRVTLSNAPQGLSLNIIQTAPSEQSRRSDIPIEKISLLICPAGRPLEPHLRSDQKCFLRFDVGFDGPMGASFLVELSEPISIEMTDADPSLLQVMTLIATEMQANRCGRPLFINRAGEILLITMMRHLTSHPQQNKGLFHALSDPRIAKSLVAMHNNPALPWTLNELANLAGMSRTSFAYSFKNAMQISPGKYLESIRLAIARQLVRNGIGLKQIASKTGYASPSTLSRALGRWN